MEQTDLQKYLLDGWREKAIEVDLVRLKDNDQAEREQMPMQSGHSKSLENSRCPNR